MAKLIGADKQGNANDTFRSPGLQPQTLSGSDKSFQFASQQQQQLGESLKSSLQFQSQTAARMSEDFSNTNRITAQTATTTLQNEGNNGFAQAMGNLANVGNMIVQTLDNRSKQEAAQAKAVRESNATTMWDRVSQWEVDAPAKARLDPAGTVKLRGEIADMFNSTEGADLLPEDREKLMKHTYGTVIAGLASKNVEDHMSQQRKLQEVNINTRKERAVFESSSLLSSLGASSTQEEQSVAVAKLSEYLSQVALSRDLDPMSKAEIQLGLTVQMNKAMFTSEENRLKAQEVITNFNTFQQDVQEARSKYPNDIEAQETAIAYSAHANKIPTSIADRYSVTEAQRRSIDRVQLSNKERDLRSEEVARELGVAGTDDEAGYDAELFSTEAALQVFASSLGDGNAELGRKTPRYLQVVAAQKARKDFQDAQVDTNQKYAQLQQQKARIAQGDSQANLTYLRTLKPSPQTDDLIKRLQIATGNNPALASMLPLIGQYEALDAARQKQFDDAYAQATAQGFNASAELTQSIDMEANAITQNLHLKQRELVRYGYGIDGKYDPFKAKTIEQRRIEQEAKRQAAYAQQGSQGGTTTGAPFDQGGGYFNGLEVFNEQQGLIMPITKAEIKRQGAANINEGVGYGRGRLHAGQDIGLDLGTPIVSQMNGKVKRIWSESDSGAGTSGNTVEIEYPDGSAHTFMHLKERPNLAVGQTVRAGQVVGKAGNTGLKGGNANVGNVHLHWEVRYGDKLSTPQEWSTKYRQSQQNRPSQPRTTGPGSSITAPIRGAQGVPIKGGMLVPNGKGGTLRVGYGEGQVFTLPQVREMNNIPVPSSAKSDFGMVLLQPTLLRGAGSKHNYVIGTHIKPDGTLGREFIMTAQQPLVSKLLQEQSSNVRFTSTTEANSYLSSFGESAHKSFVLGSDVQLKDNGQQKQRASVPAKVVETNGRIFYGPGGTRFQRDAQGSMVALPSPVSGGYSNANPLRALTNSNRATDYNINDLGNDHGFAPLKRNPSAARAVNEIAKSFGVPGEWLAEVISVETGNTFDPNQKEYGGSGATGLIQFYPDNDGGSTKTINGRVYNLSEIGRMSMEQQLRGPVKDYITEAMRSNGMKRIPTIQDMYSLIWAYGPASKARRMRDQRGPSGTEVLNRLGKFSGRRYSSVQPSPNTNIAQDDEYSSERSSKLIKRVDRSYHASCTTCNQMASASMFVPHERMSLNKGMETFNIA